MNEKKMCLGKYRSFATLTFLVIFCLLHLQGCFIVELVNKTEQEVSLSPRPLIEMSDETVWSASGDMVAQLPKQWFLVEAERVQSGRIFAVAVNPEYTLSLVFSTLSSQGKTITDKTPATVLAEVGIRAREASIDAPVTILQKPEEQSFGTKKFGVYTFTTDGGTTTTKAASFRSSQGRLYECAIVQLPFTGRKIPDKVITESLFQSILATIDF